MILHRSDYKLNKEMQDIKKKCYISSVFRELLVQIEEIIFAYIFFVFITLINI
jgi:hypothetical protein